MVLRPRVREYRVVRGDCLWKIAEAQYGNPTVWPEISRENDLPNPDLILVGMLLRLPLVHHAHHYHHHALGVPVAKGGATVPKPVGVTAPTPPVLLRAQVVDLGRPTNGAASGKGATLVSAARSTSPAHPNLEIHRLKGSALAKLVLFPAARYKFDDLAAVTLVGPVMDATLRFIGEISVQRKGTMSEVELSQRGTLSGKLKSDYDSKFVDLVGQAKVGFNSQTHMAQVSCNLTVAAKFDGQVVSLTQYEFIAPNRFKFTYKPKPIQGEWSDVVFSGNLGFELEITVKKPDSPPPAEPAPQRRPSHTTSHAWALLAAKALVVAGAAIIVADIVKDVATVGLGTPESPMSFAAASALFAKAAMMTQ
jgi:LysM domain